MYKYSIPNVIEKQDGHGGHLHSGGTRTMWWFACPSMPESVKLMMIKDCLPPLPVKMKSKDVGYYKFYYSFMDL